MNPYVNMMGGKRTTSKIMIGGLLFVLLLFLIVSAMFYFITVFPNNSSEHLAFSQMITLHMLIPAIGIFGFCIVLVVWFLCDQLMDRCKFCGGHISDFNEFACFDCRDRIKQGNVNQDGGEKK